jgi:hypothetical protein
MRVAIGRASFQPSAACPWLARDAVQLACELGHLAAVAMEPIGPGR